MCNTKRARPTQQMIQALEPRQLLTTFTGTNGPDQILVTNNMDVFINSVKVGEAGASDEIDGGGGDDTISIFGVASGLGQFPGIFVFGGDGNDTIVVGSGDFDNDIDGTVTVRGGAGTDTVILNDQNDDSPDDYFLTNSAAGGTDIYADESLAFDGTINFDGSVELKTFNFSNHNDHFHANIMPGGTTINFGGGNNLIEYGSGGILPTLGNATINGGVNTDSIVVDDSAGSSTQPNMYSITPTSVQNQTLTNFENITLNTRPALSIQAGANTINVTGYPANSFGGIVINGGDAHVSVGSQQSPVDFDTIGLLHFQLNMEAIVSVYDQDFDSSNNPWYISTDDSPAKQWLHKGASAINWTVGGDIRLYGGSTNDTFNLSGVILPVFIDGGGGSDICQESNYIASNHIPNTNLGKLDAIIRYPIEFYGGPGDDQLILDDDADQTGDGDPNYVFDSNSNLGPYGQQYHLSKGSTGLSFHFVAFYDPSTEQIKFTADADNNVITFTADSTQRFTLDGGPGNDLFLNETFAGTASVVGGAGNDSLEYDDSFSALDQVDLTSTALTIDGNHPISYDTTLEDLTVNESDTDTTNVLRSKPAALKLTVNGDAGNDHFVVGNGDLDSNGWSNVTLTGGAGNDSIEFDDHADLFTTGETELAQVNGTELDKGAAVIDSFTFESQQLDASSAGNLILGVVQGVNLNNTLIPTAVVAAGRCIINVGNPTSSSLAPISGPITLSMNPSAGANINDMFSAGNKTYTLSSGNLTIAPVSGSPLVINFSGAGLTLNANSGNNTINVLSSASGMPYIINGDDGSDTITVGDGNLNDLVSSVRVSGGNGTDSLAFNDSTDPTGQSETLTDTSFTVGTKTIPFDTAESLRLTAGLGNDLINQETDNSAALITIGGGGGNDSINLDLSNYIGITPGPNVSLSGDAGSDLLNFNDSVGTNFATITSSTYQRNSTPTFNYGTFESMVYNAGPAGTSIQIPSTAAGTPVTINAGDGNDSILVGGTIVGDGTLNHLAAPISIDAGAGSDLVNFGDANDTTAQTFHVYPTGVTRGGMSNVSFAAVEAISLSEGSGGDTTYVLPNATASISVSGNNPTSAPGDTLGLAFAAALNPVFTAGATGAGGYTFANRAPVNYTGIETKLIDAVAPTVVAASFNFNAPRPSVTVQFSEDVSTLLSAAALRLNNATSGNVINPASFQLNYAPATNTATFTFPNLPNHSLPDGNYIAAVLASLITDTFGNQMASDFSFNFFSLAGDANHDGRVDVSDLGILATNWQGTGKSFSQGDFNYDGAVDVSDLGILATNWQTSLPAAASSPMRKNPKFSTRLAADLEGEL